MSIGGLKASTGICGMFLTAVNQVSWKTASCTNLPPLQFMSIVTMTSPSKWQRRFLRLVREVASWSKDPSTKVGCVLVDASNRVISLGFNGFPAGISDDSRLEARDTKYPIILHAEENALFFVTRSVEGATAYITHFPCASCAAKLIQSKITAVVCLTDEAFDSRWQESTSYSRDILLEAGISLTTISTQSLKD